MTKVWRRWGLAVGASGAIIALLAGCTASGDDPGSSGNEDVTIEFAQWWEPELPGTLLRDLMDQFEDENPGITVELVSAPYSATHGQMVAGGVAGTMSDVVGLDRPWVRDFAAQGFLADLVPLMDEAGFDQSALATVYDVDGQQFMVEVNSGVLMLYTNDEILAQAGVTEIPTTRSEFIEAAKKIQAIGGEVSGWSLPLSPEDPNGVGHEIFSQVWASGGSILDSDGGPNVDTPEMRAVLEAVKTMWDAGVIAPGALNQKEQDKVEAFANGRLGMAFDQISRFSLIAERNPDLKFTVSPIPIADGYTGEQGATTAGWGIGIAAISEHKTEAWKLIEFIMRPDIDAQIATGITALPGAVDAVPDFSVDSHYEDAYNILKDRTSINELDLVPNSVEMQRTFNEQLQHFVLGDISLDEMLAKVESEWKNLF